MIRLGFLGGLIMALALFWWRAPSSKKIEAISSDTPHLAQAERTPSKITTPISPPVARNEPSLRSIDSVPQHSAQSAISVGSFAPSNEWPGWYCADIEGNERKSAWKNGENSDVISEIQEGTCAEWANRGPGNSFPQEPGVPSFEQFEFLAPQVDGFSSVST